MGTRVAGYCSAAPRSRTACVAHKHLPCCPPGCHISFQARMLPNASVASFPPPNPAPAVSRSALMARSLASQAAPLSALRLAAPSVISVTFLPKLRVDSVSGTEVIWVGGVVRGERDGTG